MKLALASDVHLEFGYCNINNQENAKVLILAGDIMIAEELHDFPEDKVTDVVESVSQRQDKAKSYRRFLKNCSEQFEHVIYVAGNHEFYHGKWPKGMDYLREETEKFSNVHYMENQSYVIDDVTFIGCTLWTDLNKYDPVTVYTVNDYMNDYRIIRNSDKDYRRLNTNDTGMHHKNSMKYITDTIENAGDKVVVVTHMAPSRLSTHPRYKDDYHVNGGYSSNLEEFILDNTKIKVWCHGHTHNKYDYTLGETRVLCNPRGYVGYEVTDTDFDLLYFDV